MQLSRLTFSLASLVVLLAFGLVFAPVSVMAHNEAAAVEADDTATPPVVAADAIAPHTHPTATITVQDIDYDAGTDGDQPSIMVVDVMGEDITYVKRTAATGGPGTTISLLVSFSDDLAAESGGTASEDGALSTTLGEDIVVVGRNPSNSNPITLTLESAARVSGSDTDFNVVVGLADNVFANQDPAIPQVEVFVTVKANVVTTPITAQTIDSNGNPVGPFQPVGNDASAMPTKFVVIQDDADFPSDMPGLPTVAVTQADPTEMADAAFTVNLEFSSDVALTARDIVIVPSNAGAAGTPMPDTADATEDMEWSVVITPIPANVPATGIMVSVDPSIASPDAEMGSVTVMATGTGGAGTGRMLADKGYLVIVRDIDMAEAAGFFGTATPDLFEWADMPDLHELFIENTDGGGSLQLTSNKADGTNVGARKVVFSEVMWAIDEKLVGDDTNDDNQWFEIYNRSGAAVPISGISFATSQGRPALAQSTDLVSNVVGGGSAWIRTKGQNGNSGSTVNGVTTGQQEFITMYRKRYHNDSAGWNGGEWIKSTQLYKPNHRGTPGMGQAANVPTITATNANRSPIIFNEIGNHSNPDYEWIELRNVSDGNVNLKNYEVTMATTKGANQTGHNDVDLIDFTGADRNVPAGGILLVVKKDPTGDSNHPLAAGWNFGARNTWTVAKPGESNYVPGVNADSARYLVASTFNEMPDGDFVLILRNRQDRNGSTNDNNIRDVAGYVPDNGLKVDSGTLFTNLWPLKNFGAPWYRNEFNNNTVHRRQHAGTDGTKRSRTDRDHIDDGAFRDVGWTGIGYKRNAARVAENGGTPGYPDSALHGNINNPGHGSETDAAAKTVIISEIMYATGTRANIPQWIELRNTSKTTGVNITNWRVTIINHDQDADGDTFNGDLSKNYDITGDGRVIPPGQTFLLAAYSGRNETNLPSERIQTLRAKRGELILSQYGFEITLLTKGKDNNDANRKLADRVGNLATVAAGAGRVRGNPQSYEDPAWMLPMGTNDDGDRISIVRTSIMGDPVNGQLEGAWNSFDMSAQFGATLDPTSYGHSTDLSNPGHSAGGVLPVSLSKFRPERMKDTGAVVIRWITESELNNAGFNILRSETRDGEFTKLNTKLIAGQGTTSERTTYEYADTSAKPNVVYYYQIQDVSLDGQVQTLRQSRLKGNVTAAGKLTTTWGELKLQD